MEAFEIRFEHRREGFDQTTFLSEKRAFGRGGTWLAVDGFDRARSTAGDRKFSALEPRRELNHGGPASTPSAVIQHAPDIGLPPRSSSTLEQIVRGGGPRAGTILKSKETFRTRQRNTSILRTRTLSSGSVQRPEADRMNRWRVARFTSPAAFLSSLDETYRNKRTRPRASVCVSRICQARCCPNQSLRPTTSQYGPRCHG